MEEFRVLENALKNCQLLELSLRESIKEVRRLNVRYNIDWFVNNYNVYVANIWTQYQGILHKDSDKMSLKHKLSPSKSHANIVLRSTTHKSSASLALSTRSSNELVGSNRKINYKFLKIKRGMEALLIQLHHTIEIANRQKNVMHLNVSARGGRVRVCCH